MTLKKKSSIPVWEVRVGEEGTAGGLLQRGGGKGRKDYALW